MNYVCQYTIKCKHNCKGYVQCAGHCNVSGVPVNISLTNKTKPLDGII